MISYSEAIRRESARFARAIAAAGLNAAVPSCPEWNTADLLWHLAEVQYFWATIAGDLLQSPDRMKELRRPRDEALTGLFAEQTDRLVAALGAHDPGEECWSWYEGGHSIAWVRRRQAHEALIHRVDAELAASATTPLDDMLATDGVDEILTVMIDCRSIPEWSRFNADGTTAVLATPDRRWEMALGRFRGTSPNTGNTYDEPAILLGSVTATPSVTISGSGADLDLWLWGRGTTERLRVEGDAALAGTLRAAAAASTQ
jgi:uncharacterized protein (TIGR03083 family)